MIYTVTISPAIDYVVHLPSMRDGATNRSTGEEYYFGGKGINVSVVLHELGIANKALGFIAGFTGKALDEGLKEQGIDTDFITLDNGITRINVKIKAGKETEINSQGALPQEKDFALLEEKIHGLARGDILVLSGSVPAGTPPDLYASFCAIAEEAGAETVVDTRGEQLMNALMYEPFLVKPNQTEIREIFGSNITAEEGAERLKNAGARNVIVSLGSEGALMLSEDGNRYKCGTARGKTVNSVGSGDSMVAGFLAGYLQSHDYDYAIRLGSAAGSATAFSPGLACRKDIMHCLSGISLVQ